MKVDVAFLGSPSLTVRRVYVRELEQRHSEFRSCVKVEVAVLGFPTLLVLKVSVDVKQH